jgi:ATP-dependent helicase/nuclease subunit B
MTLPAPGLYSIPAHRPFLDDLAAAILDQVSASSDPLALSRMTVLLPTRRACRAMQDGFLRLSERAGLILPRLVPIGDIDEDELLLTDSPVADGLADESLPPAMPELRRRLLLAEELRTRFPGGGAPMPVDQAAELAGELGRLLDLVQTERLDFSTLDRLVPEDYAEHWQHTLSFLRLLTETWPERLTAEAAVDPAQRRNLVLAARLEAWRTRPPTDPVIAAGSTGSIPATADLLALIADLPAGFVVLPGLDRVLDDEAWRRLDATHPQFGLHQLLDRLGRTRTDVGEWPSSGAHEDGAGVARLRLFSEALRPAATIESWRDERGTVGADALSGVTLIQAREPHEEAGAIAVALREVLEVPGRTAALVTPDRDLARRVAAALNRWGVTIDDSAGTPLSETPAGVFLRAVVRMVHEDFSPVSLLSSLKHPLAAGEMPAAAFRAVVRAMERIVLRGPRPAPGVEGLRAAALRARESQENSDRELLAEPGTWDLIFKLIDLLDKAAAPLAEIWATRETGLPALIGGHVALAEALAASDGEAGAARLWAGEDGEVLAGFAAELAIHGAGTGAVPPDRYMALFDTLLAGRVVRPRFGTHPRLSILGLMEARLQRCDVMVLAGLNEGIWPGEADVDPWMSRPMRADFGLPPPERRIGLSAHDFAQGFCARTVVLTRSERVEGAPAIPSRWLTRLDVAAEVLGVSGGAEMRARGDAYLEWWRGLESSALGGRMDAGVGQAGARPRPAPPVEARPRSLSVTQIETWMRDPYSIYAREVLQLKALPPLDQAVDAATYGTQIHRVFDRFLQAHPEGPLPADAKTRLLETGEEVLGPFRNLPAVWAFWWPRFTRMVDWFLATETSRRASLVRTHAEVRGMMVIDTLGKPFVLRARADRIDELAGGGLAVIDFKTGAPPSKKEVAAGFAPQLPLEAAILARGGFEGVPEGDIRELAFWRLSGGREAGKVYPAADDPSGIAQEAYDGLRALVENFDDPATPYEARPRPKQAPKYSDYEHLARVREWANYGDGEDGL